MSLFFKVVRTNIFFYLVIFFNHLKFSAFMSKHNYFMVLYAKSRQALWFSLRNLLFSIFRDFILKSENLSSKEDLKAGSLYTVIKNQITKTDDMMWYSKIHLEFNYFLISIEFQCTNQPLKMFKKLKASFKVEKRPSYLFQAKIRKHCFKIEKLLHMRALVEKEIE